jgi:excinuclease ABC subunit C
MIKQGLEILKETIKSAPNSSGVYRMIDSGGKILYVGKAKNLASRLRSYTQFKDLPYRLKQMVANISAVEIIKTSSETEALLLEAQLIKTLKPKYNILLRDGKTYPFVMVNQTHEFPGIFKHRGAKNKSDKYFGPFVSAGDVNHALDLLKKSFLLRSCSDQEFARRKRPCLEYQIKRCSAPCVGKISSAYYQKLLDEAYLFLKGKSSEVQSAMAAQMQEESKKLNYEKAAILRDRIKSLTAMQAKQHVDCVVGDADFVAIAGSDGQFSIELFFYRGGQNYGNDVFFIDRHRDFSKADILGAFIKQFYYSNLPPQNIYLNVEVDDREAIAQVFTKIAEQKINILVPKSGDKKKLMEIAENNANYALQKNMVEGKNRKKYIKEMQEVFELQKLPEYIEIYDNSHISGEFAVGGLVAFSLDEGFDKQGYRKFNIKTTDVGDDYAMLREVLTRRLSKLKEGRRPDLLIVDGGKGQAEITRAVLQELNISNIDFICVSKGVDRNAGRERFTTHKKTYFSLEQKTGLLYFMQNLRDEAHRFAISSHRKKRSKAIRSSALDDIPAIGAARKKALLNHFGSVAKIKTATIAELLKVKNISKNLAKDICDFFHNP